jgi:hypothetical protein
VADWTNEEILTPVSETVGGAVDTVTEGAQDLWNWVWD